MIKCMVLFVQFLVQYMQECSGIDLSMLGVEKVVVFGELGGSILEIYGFIEEGFGGVMVYDIMGVIGCYSLMGISCEEYNGIYYYVEDNVLFEICDFEMLQFLLIEDGVEGEIVFIGLDCECGLLICWRDKDIIQVRIEFC